MPRVDVSMTSDEVAHFLDGRHTAIVATIGRSGFPHQSALWYAYRDGQVAFATYRKSQKVRNIERDARVGVLCEAGDAYDELRGVSISGHAELIHDFATVVELCFVVGNRYENRGIDRADAEQRARGRVAVVVHPERTRSWDHRKFAQAASGGSVTDPRGSDEPSPS